MMVDHKDYKFSVTIHTDELALVFCMRGLSVHCQETGNAMAPPGNTTREDWEEHGHQVTFHFDRASYRDNFISEAERLFQTGLWTKVEQSDDTPAKRSKASQKRWVKGKMDEILS